MAYLEEENINSIYVPIGHIGLDNNKQYRYNPVLWTRIRDPAEVFFGSRILDPGSRIPTPFFLELSDKFLGIKFYNSLKTCPNFFFSI